MTDELFVLPQSALDYAKTVTAKRGHAGTGAGRRARPADRASIEHQSTVAARRSPIETERAQLDARSWQRHQNADPACELWAPNQDA